MTLRAAAVRIGPALRRWGADALRLLPSIGIGVGLLVLRSGLLAVVWFLVSRAAYVVWVGRALRFACGEGEAAWIAFRRRASLLMDNDGAAFAALCWVTSGWMGQWSVAPWVTTVVGLLLVVVGVGTKMWATASLPVGAYHWRDFFVACALPDTRRGPYRFLADPMYTLGYAHAYGIALLFRSGPALAAATVAQGSMLALNVFVERRYRRR